MNIQAQYEFEEYAETPRRRADAPKATITKSGLVVFNKKFAEQYWEDLRGSNIVFFYDRKNRVIGLKEIPSPEHNSYPVRRIANGKIMAITARAFLKHYGIDFKKSHSYAVETSMKEDGNLMIYINLKGENEETMQVAVYDSFGRLENPDKK